MCTRIVIPLPAHPAQAGGFDYASFFNAAMLAGTVLGYLGVALLSKRFAPISSKRGIHALAAILAGCGSLGMSLLIGTASPEGVLLPGYLLCLALFSLGNALVLMLWGELWSTLATGTVGRHLYSSYLFAIMLFFVIRTIPEPVIDIVTACLLPISVVILRFAEELPRRVKPKSEAPEPRVPWLRALVAIGLLNLAWGLCQKLVGLSAPGADTTLNALLLAGFLLALLVLFLLALKPADEPLVMLKPVMPALACGMIFIVIAPDAWLFVGDGIAITGGYCLDMLIMLVACDMAHKQRIPVAWGFGLAIIVARVGSFIGSSIVLFQGPLSKADIQAGILLAAVLVILVGFVVFTESDLQKIYQVAPAALLLDTSIEQRCKLVSQKYNLSAREEEVLVLLAHGRSGPYIGNELCIAPGTAKRHISNIYRKIGVADRQGLHDIVATAGSNE